MWIFQVPNFFFPGNPARTKVGILAFKRTRGAPPKTPATPPRSPRRPSGPTIPAAATIPAGSTPQAQAEGARRPAMSYPICGAVDTITKRPEITEAGNPRRRVKNELGLHNIRCPQVSVKAQHQPMIAGKSTRSRRFVLSCGVQIDQSDQSGRRSASAKRARNAAGSATV